MYLYRTIDSTGATIDFLLCRRYAMLRRSSACSARPAAIHRVRNLVINTDKARLYGPAIDAVRAERLLRTK